MEKNRLSPNSICLAFKSPYDELPSYLSHFSTCPAHSVFFTTVTSISQPFVHTSPRDFTQMSLAPGTTSSFPFPLPILPILPHSAPIPTPPQRLPLTNLGYTDCFSEPMRPLYYMSVFPHYVSLLKGHTLQFCVSQSTWSILFLLELNILLYPVFNKGDLKV